MGCYSRLLAAQAMIPELPVLCKEGPTGSMFVERVGLIDMRAQAELPSARRTDTPTGLQSMPPAQ